MSEAETRWVFALWFNGRLVGGRFTATADVVQRLRQVVQPGVIIEPQVQYRPAESSRDTPPEEAP